MVLCAPGLLIAPPEGDTLVMTALAREFARGWLGQTQVVRALVLRETKTRFGTNQLGYLWAFANPLMFIGMFAVMFHVTGRTLPQGMDTLTFLATGVLTHKFFLDVSGRSMSAIAGNRSLLFYPHVRPLDLIFARVQLEFATLAVVFVGVILANGLWNQHLQIDSLLMVVLGAVLATGLGATLGLTLCSLSVFSNSVERLAPPMMRPLFWTSGVFFTANELPPAARDFLLWNPVLHCTEIVRSGMFVSYSDSHASIAYPLSWIIGLAFVGLTLERVARRHVEV